MTSLTIATRGSKLAMWQAEHVAGLIQAVHPQVDIDFKIVKTSGDKILDVPLAKVGGKGLFVKEIEEAILAGEADLAVHSMKDVPAELISGLALGVMPERDDTSDCFLSMQYPDWQSLPQGAVVGTSSLRRQAQLLALRPDLTIRTLRGNLDTRLGKLEKGEYDAIVVASVGLKRLGLQAPYACRLVPPDFYPALGQGALGIEYPTANTELDHLLSALDHGPTRVTVTAERSFLHELEGGCQVPIGGMAEVEGDQVILHGFVSDVRGNTVILEQDRAGCREAESLGRSLARKVLDRGGREILRQVYA
ncbi:MAG: hydroxymethylbilane synthase, partial [Desulfovermiculus sp.]|nr:hydroxymethylbilane synthase [Desulfovermiculus sp.]